MSFLTVFLGQDTAIVDAEMVVDRLIAQKCAILGHLADKLVVLMAMPENQAKPVSPSREQSCHPFCFQIVQNKRDSNQMGSDGDAEDSERAKRNRGE